MQRRIGVFGTTEETLRLLRTLLASPQVEVVALWDPDLGQARARIQRIVPQLAHLIDPLLTDDADAFVHTPELQAVIDGTQPPSFEHRFARAREHGIQVLSPLGARMLWGYEGASHQQRDELLATLSELVGSLDWAIDEDSLSDRVLEIAIAATGAQGGSLMGLVADRGELWMRAARGVERELWPKIRIPLGVGIAGRVAAEARPLLVRGPADPASFRNLRPRADVACALCVPLIDQGQVLGVLNLHHAIRTDAFDEDDLEFVCRLAALDARMLTRAYEQRRLREQAARYGTARAVREILGQPEPLTERLRSLCRYAADCVGGGRASLYLVDSRSSLSSLSPLNSLSPLSPLNSLNSLEPGNPSDTTLPQENLPNELLRAASSEDAAGSPAAPETTALVLQAQGLEGRVAATRRPAFVQAEDGSLAAACLPLLAGEQWVGLLCVHSGASAIAESEIESILRELATAVAEPIARARREESAATHAQRLARVHEYGLRIVTERDPSAADRLACEALANTLEADHVVLRRLDDRTGRFGVRATHGTPSASVETMLFELDRRLCTHAIRTRAAVHLPDLRRDTLVASETVAREFGSAICEPLLRDGRVVGTLAAYARAPEHLDSDAAAMLSKLIPATLHATLAALPSTAGASATRFDLETGLPDKSLLVERIEEEIGRAAGRANALAVAVCRIENLTEIAKRTNPAHALRVMQSTADALRAHLRNFDVPARIGRAEFAVLMPEPGVVPPERIFELARAVSDEITKNQSLNEPLRIVLAFGYAVHPQDGATAEALLTQAAEPRIRMI